jgi:energy-coupling factor transport system permease protein
VVSHHQLIASAPRAFHEAGLVLTVGLAFVPSTIAAVDAVRQADLARTGGRAVRRGRTTRLLIPVVETGMERALALAESMDARGFARLAPDRRERWAGWSSLVALLCLGGAFVALVGRAGVVAAALGAAGAASLLAAVVWASVARPRTRYRPQRPDRRDAAVCAVAVAGPVGLAAIALLGLPGADSLRWNANPLAWPVLHPVVAVMLACSAVPLLVPFAQAPVRHPGQVAGPHDQSAPALPTVGAS